MKHLSRRQFIQQATTLTVATATGGLPPPSLAKAAGTLEGSSKILDEGWEFLRTPLAGPWEVWMNPPLAPWTGVSMPHCFNAYDGCDPDIPAYRGKGWYRCRLRLANPYEGGRTLLHFEGAGQSSEIYIGNSLAARHIGGYDEFVVDITDLARKPGASDKNGTLLGVLCDNSPDMDRMPSDISDFTLYGGLYRNVAQRQNGPSL